MIFPPPVKTIEKGHGRCDIRSIRVSGSLKGYSEFPGLEQVFKIERTRIINKTGEKSTVITDGCTSLTEKQADARTLLDISRGHWTIENKLHYVRDMAFDEDRSQVRMDSGPRVMASIRNLVISTLRILGVTNIAGALRENSLNKPAMFRMLGFR